MKDCIKHSARASLALIGKRINQMGIWNTIANYVDIKQKTVVHTPIEKLQDAFINIMAGGHGISEVNQKCLIPSNHVWFPISLPRTENHATTTLAAMVVLSSY